MILLEVHNRIVEELLTQQIETYLRGEKLVEIKTTIIGKTIDSKRETYRDFSIHRRFRWCNLTYHSCSRSTICGQYQIEILSRIS